jgi:hypothetical protein
MASIDQRKVRLSIGIGSRKAGLKAPKRVLLQIGAGWQKPDNVAPM